MDRCVDRKICDRLIALWQLALKESEWNMQFYLDGTVYNFRCLKLIHIVRSSLNNMTENLSNQKIPYDHCF